jgi:hypothetical protein
MENHTSIRNHKSMSFPASSSSSLVQVISQSDFHDHNMLIYPDLATYRKIYSESAKQALDINEIVLLITTYDSFDRINDCLTQVGISINKETKEGNLVIMDAFKAYQIDTYGALKFGTTLAKRAERQGKAGIFALTETGSFFIAERIAPLIEYEKGISKKLNFTIEVHCSYHKDDFESLSKEQQQTILSAQSHH